MIRFFLWCDFYRRFNSSVSYDTAAQFSYSGLIIAAVSYIDHGFESPAPVFVFSSYRES